MPGDAEGARRRRRITRLQRFVLNPPAKAGVWLGLVPGYALIETRGRRTGRRRRTVVGVHQEGNTLWVVAEQGRHAGYVANLEADPEVRVRLRGRWRLGTARTVPDDNPFVRLESFRRRSHAATVRRLGTALLTVRIDLRP